MTHSADEAICSHYIVLGTDPSADYAEIRRKYRAAVLALHPDRFSASGLIQEGERLADCDHHLSVGASSVKVSAPGLSSEPDQFVRVQKAWETLRDPESRARYDHILSAQRLAQQREEASQVIGEEVCIQEMDLTDGEAGEYTYPCRCGDYFMVSLEELKEARFINGEREKGDIAEQHAGKGVEWQQISLVLPCQSCSLHIRLLFPLQAA